MQRNISKRRTYVWLAVRTQELAMESTRRQSHQGPPSAAAEMENGISQIAQFYQGQVVFITGGTGFVGKVLLEKLLRSFPGIKEIYLLVRAKEGEEPEARIEAMLNSKVFERVRQEQPGALEKVKAVAGDLTQPNLGFSATDQDTLVSKVSVVFHSAATVNFNEPLKRAVEMNLRGTRRVLDLCKKMSGLRALVYVSTAYSNCNRLEVDEVVYTPPVDPSKIIAAAEWMDYKMMDAISGLLLGNHPNTYTFTKALAEALLLNAGERVPIAIVRPSIVIGSWKEPFPGWVDNYNGLTGTIVSCGLGRLKSFINGEDCIADIIPVDIVANTLISVAWHTATTRPNHVMVYHSTSGALQQQTWGEVSAMMQELIVRHPLPNLTRYPKFYATNSPLWHDVTLWHLNYLPALVGDLGLKLIGQKPRFVPIYRKVRKSMDVAEYFTTRSWLFPSNNLVALADTLSPADKQLLDVDIRKMPWFTYWDHYMLGIHKYLFNADVSMLPDARKHMKWLYTKHRFLNLLPVTVVWRLLKRRPQTAQKL
ncbi:fatty acyl-CoA reductase 1-like [Haemaphysalis longicornis]